MKCILFCPLAVNRNPLESLRNIVNAVSDRKCIQYDKTNLNAHEQVLVSYWVLSFCFDIIWGFSIQWCTHNAHAWSDITESHFSFMKCTTGWKLKPRLHCHIPDHSPHECRADWEVWRQWSLVFADTLCMDHGCFGCMGPILPCKKKNLY
jgi:hypothetical protein